MRYPKLAASAAVLALLGVGIWFVFWMNRLLRFFGASPAAALPLALAFSAAALMLMLIRPIPIREKTIIVFYLLLFGLLLELPLRIPALTPLRDSGAAALLSTAAALLYARIHGKKTVLTRRILPVDTPLPGGRLRIGLISDVHMGLSVDAARLTRAVGLLSEEAPDLIVIAGDLVDDQTGRDEMESACRILSEARTRYGVYLIFGNHDLALHGPALSFSRSEYEQALTRSGIRILDDQCAVLPGPVTLIGRRDAGIRGTEPRRTLARLLSDAAGPWIVCDHQPGSARESAESGALLHLSGHTHGGQLWPANLLLSLVSLRSPQIGCRRIKNTWVVVSCGLGTRGVRMRSGSTAEAQLIELENRTDAAR